MTRAVDDVLFLVNLMGEIFSLWFPSSNERSLARTGGDLVCFCSISDSSTVRSPWIEEDRSSMTSPVNALGGLIVLRKDIFSIGEILPTIFIRAEV